MNDPTHPQMSDPPSSTGDRSGATPAPRVRPAFPQRSRRVAQRGVALIEALVSLLIFAFGVLGLLGLEARAIDYSVDAEDRNRAALLANEIGSSLWLTNSVLVNAATQTNWNAIAAANLPGGGATINSVSGPPTNYADITITWTPLSHSLSQITTSSLTTRVVLP